MTAGGATTKLYLADPYTHSFEARVLRCDKTGDGRLAAVLDETFFYPESGGQTADRGTIAGVAVVDVWEDDAHRVLHGIDQVLQPGPVTCRIDWQRRFDHMQQHTGQHILSRAFIQAGGLQTVSFHMGDEACTIDLDGDVAPNVLEAAEHLANEVIQQDRTVQVRNLSPEAVDDAALRKKLPEGITEVRLVEIDGFDVIGCCGTHVRRTGELGLVKILKQEKVKGETRITFKVGGRAVGDYAQKHGILKDLAVRFTTSYEGLGDKVAKLSAQAHSDRKRVQALSKRLAAVEARELVASALQHGDTRWIVRVFPGYDAEYLRLLSSALKAEAATINLLGNDDGAIVCNASSGVTVDFSRSLIEPAKAAGGSGGGKGSFAIVRLPAGVAVESFLAESVERIKAELRLRGGRRR